MHRSAPSGDVPLLRRRMTTRLHDRLRHVNKDARRCSSEDTGLGIIRVSVTVPIRMFRLSFRFSTLILAACLVSPVTTLAQGRTERIAGGTLKVCVWPDYYGITWRNPKTGQLTGIDVDLAREFAADLKAQVEFVDSSFAKLIDDVTTDRCDIAMFAIGVTPARRERLAFSAPHLQSDIVGITTRANTRVREWADIDRAGTVVAVARGTLHEGVMKDKLKAARLVVLDTPQAREQEVQSGRADVFMTDIPFSRRMLDNADWARLVSPPSTYHVTPYAYAVKPGDDAWLARVNRFVADIKRDGRLAAAARRHKLEAIVAP
jgi:ABC-type amino acid transport substrate-binding protein